MPRVPDDPRVEPAEPPTESSVARRMTPRPMPAVTEDDVRGRLERLAALGARSAEVAHELRNALSVLETSLHLARRALKGSPEALAKADPHLGRIAEQVHAGQQIVHGVLDEAREGLDLAFIDLRALVLEVVGGLPRPENVSIEVEIARLRVYIDGRLIRQLLSNLVRNAVESLASARASASGRGGIVRVIAEVEGERTLKLSVEDDGPGIDPTIAARLFQPFATAGKRGGTGLGLALCKRIAQAHGGNIVANARTPRGTSMLVTLPLQAGAKPPSESKQRVREPR